MKYEWKQEKGNGRGQGLGNRAGSALQPDLPGIIRATLNSGLQAASGGAQ